VRSILYRYKGERKGKEREGGWGGGGGGGGGGERGENLGGEGEQEANGQILREESLEISCSLIGMGMLDAAISAVVVNDYKNRHMHKHGDTLVANCDNHARLVFVFCANDINIKHKFIL